MQPTATGDEDPGLVLVVLLAAIALVRRTHGDRLDLPVLLHILLEVLQLGAAVVLTLAVADVDFAERNPHSVDSFFWVARNSPSF
jgi:hypothetical protein